MLKKTNTYKNALITNISIHQWMISKNYETIKNIKLKHNRQISFNEWILILWCCLLCLYFVPANFCLFSFVELTSLLWNKICTKVILRAQFSDMLYNATANSHARTRIPDDNGRVASQGDKILLGKTTFGFIENIPLLELQE